MILRAVFWIAVVSFFLPREPDLGLGRPGTGQSGIGGLLSNVQTSAANSCSTSKGLCAVGSTLFGAFQGIAVQSLDDVKADIERSRNKQIASN